MTPSELIAIAAHLHVAMRRKMGRVTDTEWMASDYAYAQAMSSLALRHAEETQDNDLQKWASRLTEAWLERLPRPAPAEPKPTEGRKAEASARREAPEQRYVWGVRC